MSEELLPYGSSRYTGLVTKQCQAKIVFSMLAPYGSTRFASVGTKQQTGKVVAGRNRLIRRNARQG